jgi:hypothetical protein
LLVTLITNIGGTWSPWSSSFCLVLAALFCHLSVRKKKTDCEGLVRAILTASLKKIFKASLTILLMFKFK